MPAPLKTDEIKFRTTKKAKAQMKRNAKMYAGGNLSLWLEIQGTQAAPATDPKLWKRLTKGKSPSPAPIQAEPGPEASAAGGS